MKKTNFYSKFEKKFKSRVNNEENISRPCRLMYLRTPYFNIEGFRTDVQIRLFPTLRMLIRVRIQFTESQKKYLSVKINNYSYRA